MPDTEQLAIEVLAKIGDLEKNMKRANALTAKAYSDMAKGSKSATRQMEADMVRSTTRINQAVALTAGKIGDAGKAFAGNLARNALAAGVALLSVALVVNKTKEALEEFGDIADKSAQSGLDAETFQELAYQASLAGVGMDDLSGSLNTFNKNSGLAVVNKGKMVQALKALNPALLENIRNADSQAERVKLAADAIDQASTSSEKAAISTALFGANLVGVFAGGSAAMANTASKARELGIIIDNELISRADELGDQFDTASQVMDRQFKKTLIDLAPLLISSAQLAGDLARGITAIIDSMRSVENQSLSTLETSQTANALKRLDLEQKISDLKQQEDAGSIALMDRAVLADLQAQYDVLKKQDVIATNLIGKRREAMEIAKKMAGDGTGGGGEDDAVLPPITTPGGSTRNQAAEDAVRQAEAVKKLIADLEFERSLIGKTEVEQAKMNALRQAGAAATEEQKAQIGALIEASAKEKAAVEAAMQSVQLQRDMLGGALTDVRTAFEDGKITAEEWRDVLVNAIGKVADAIQTQLINALITPANGGFNIFGALFGLGGAVAGGIGGGAAGGVGVANASAPASLPSALRSAAAARPGGGEYRVRLVRDGLNLRPDMEFVADERIGKHVPAMTKKGVEDYSRHVLPGDVKKIIGRPKDRRLDR